MKITFDRKSFLRRLKLAVSAVSVKGYVPTLDNVKLTACAESIIVQATDTVTSIRIVLDCSGADFCVINEGQVLIPAKNVSKILEKSREKTLTLELDNTKIIMSGVSERHEFDVSDPDEFPDVVVPDTNSCHIVRADTMSNAIKRTVFATDKDNRKYALGGICFSTDGEIINATATSGVCLAWQASCATQVEGHNVESAIVPVEAGKLVMLGLKDKELASDVRVTFTDKLAVFQFSEKKGITIVIRLIEGRFPKWQGIVPNAAHMHYAKVTNIKDLLSALKSISAVLGTRDPSVELLFDAYTLTISAVVSASKGQNSSVMTVPIGFSGTAMMKLNPKFLIDYLNVLEADTMLCWYIPDGKEVNPTMLCVENNTVNLGVATSAAKESYTYIIMTKAVDSPIIPEAEAERERKRKEREEEAEEDDNEEEDNDENG